MKIASHQGRDTTIFVTSRWLTLLAQSRCLFPGPNTQLTSAALHAMHYREKATKSSNKVKIF